MPIRTITRGLFFGPPPTQAVPKAKPEKKKREKVKADPRHVAAARELRDRWLERVNADPSLLASQCKYDVSKALTSPASKAATAGAQRAANTRGLTFSGCAL
jgi:hypothetical protein